MNPLDLTLETLSALIRNELDEPEALSLLAQMTPERVNLPLLQQALTCMQETALSVSIPAEAVLDCCGTGGSGLSHFNTSTTAAFVLAAGGVPVVKFGNWGFSSASGSFDLLAQLGISHQLDPQRIPAVIDECKVAFLFAPACYPALAGLARLRKKLGQRTLFNFLGPLLNPVQPAYRLLGVSHAGMQDLMAEHLSQSSDCQHAWLVHGADGLDEIAPHGPSRVLAVQQGTLHEFEPDTGNEIYALPVGEHPPAQNFKIFQQLLSGADKTSVYYRMVCLNAGAGFLISGQVDTLEEGIRKTQTLLKSGAVTKTLEQCKRIHEQCQKT